MKYSPTGVIALVFISLGMLAVLLLLADKAGLMTTAAAEPAPIMGTDATVACFSRTVNHITSGKSHRVYFETPDGLFQALPDNEAIVQKGADVHFTGSKGTGFTAGDFVIRNASAPDIIALFKGCTG